jgi:protein TonB
MKKRGGTFWIGVAVIASLFVNLALLGLASLLASKHAKPQDITDPISVSLVNLEAPEPLQQREIKEPEKPKPQEKNDFMPDLVQPDFSGSAAGMDLGVVINLGDLGGGEAVAEEFVFEAYELDQAPQPIVRVPPVYPYKAREQGIEGAVQVKLLVNPDGSVGEFYIIDARPKGQFEDAVAKCVPQWRFSPGKIDGETVTAWVVTTIRFDL